MIAGVVLADGAAETVAAAPVKRAPAAVDGALFEHISAAGLGEGWMRRSEHRGCNQYRDRYGAVDQSRDREGADDVCPNPKHQRGVYQSREERADRSCRFRSTL